LPNHYVLERDRLNVFLLSCFRLSSNLEYSSSQFGLRVYKSAAQGLTSFANCHIVIGQIRWPMLLQINYKSGKPVYLQVVDQIKAAAASGAMQAGEPLPSIRPLAEDLRINRNTIAKAYTELESQGVIETIPGKGCFLKPNNSPLKKEVRRKLLIDEIDQVVVQAHHLQVSRDEFLAIVRERLDAIEKKKRTNEQENL
jgi:GntR family transcriptional regulator